MLIARGRAMLSKLSVDAAQHGLLRGASAFAAIRAAGGLLLYASQVLLAQWIGIEQFGLFSQAWAWAYLLAAVASLGVPTGAVRFIPQYRARGDADNLLRFVRWSWLVVAVAGGVVVLVGWLVLWLAGHLLQPGASGALFIAFMAIPVLAISLLQVQMARALGQIALAFAPMQVVRPALFIALGYGWLVLGGSTDATDFLLLTALAFLIVTGLQARQILGLLRVEIRRLAQPVAASAAGSRHWLRTSLPMLAFSIAQIALTESGIIMVGLLRPPEEVAVFAAAARTANLLTMMAMAIDNITVPRIAALHAGERQPSIELLLRPAIRWAFLLSLVMMLAVAVAGEWILRLFGTGFSDGFIVLLVLAAGLVVRAALAPAPAILNVTGEQDVVTIASLAVLAGGLVLSVPLILQFGLIGAALAQAAMTIMLRAALLGVLRRRVGVSGLLTLPSFISTPAGKPTSP